MRGNIKGKAPTSSIPRLGPYQQSQPLHADIDIGDLDVNFLSWLVQSPQLCQHFSQAVLREQPRNIAFAIAQSPVIVIKG